jgi:hypothetical protein
MLCRHFSKLDSFVLLDLLYINYLKWDICYYFKDLMSFNLLCAKSLQDYYRMLGIHWE